MGTTHNWPGFSGAVLHAPSQHCEAAVAAEPPKLEEFFGVQPEKETAPASSGRRPFGTGTTIGLSMIKNWLRSQPAPAAAANDNMAIEAVLPKGDDAVVASGAVVETAQQKKATAETFGQRTSVYRGVTKHRWTGRYEAHLWDNSCRREGQTHKGRQVYLGGYDKEEKAARAYDLAALKYWGTTTTNFPVSEYEKELEEMKYMTRQEYVASLRRKSSGFSRGASMYRGVTRHHQHGRWQARIGRVAGNKDLYLGTFSTQEEAAEAYDIAAIKFRGLNAVTNFDMSRYDVKSIMESRIPIGGSATKRTMDMPEHSDMDNGNDARHLAASNLLTDGIGSYGLQHGTYDGWAPITFLPPVVATAAHRLHKLHYFPTVQNTHNFFQQSAVQEVMHYPDMHPQSLLDSNSGMYIGGVGYHGAVGRSSYAMPHVQGDQAASSSEDVGTVSDLYNGQNFYYYSRDSHLGDPCRNDTYEQDVYENI